MKIVPELKVFKFNTWIIGTFVVPLVHFLIVGRFDFSWSWTKQRIAHPRCHVGTCPQTRFLDWATINAKACIQLRLEQLTVKLGIQLIEIILVKNATFLLLKNMKSLFSIWNSVVKTEIQCQKNWPIVRYLSQAAKVDFPENIQFFGKISTFL